MVADGIIETDSVTEIARTPIRRNLGRGPERHHPVGMCQREGSIPVGDGRIDRQGVISRAVRVAAERIVMLVLQEILPFNLLLNMAGARFGGPCQIGMRGGSGQARKGSAGLLVERR